jgi:hypothetical protein
MPSHLIHDGNKSDTLIVSFGGMGRKFGGIMPFEFLNFLTKHFNNIDKHFYTDIHGEWYHKGIDGISTSIDETVIYLKRYIYKYKNVIFLGVSAGGYAAILFGSLLNVNKVLAFVPQTKLNRKLYKNYNNLNYVINNKTKYHIYADSEVTGSNITNHHISHCENIDKHPNVYLVRKDGVDVKVMRDNGELLIIIKGVVNDA